MEDKIRARRKVATRKPSTQAWFEGFLLKVASYTPISLSTLCQARNCPTPKNARDVDRGYLERGGPTQSPISINLSDLPPWTTYLEQKVEILLGTRIFTRQR